MSIMVVGNVFVVVVVVVVYKCILKRDDWRWKFYSLTNFIMMYVFELQYNP